MTWFWLSNRRMTVTVGVDAKHVIREAPPIVRKFVGQDFWRLREWMGRMDRSFGVIVSRLDEPAAPPT